MSLRSTCLVAAGAMSLAWGSAIPAAATAGAGAVTVRTATVTGLGTIIVTATGRALYETSATGKAAACTGACAARWHPLVIAATAKPVAGRGARPALLGTAKRADGHLQVTYGGRRLFLFGGDTKPDSVTGQDLGGVWHAISPSGRTVLASVATGTSTTNSSTGMSTGSGSATTAGSGTTTDPSTSSAPGSTANPGMWCAANPKSCVNGVPVTPGSG